MAKKLPLTLFSGFGVEIEYMIVNRQSLNVIPIADKLLYDSNLGQLTEVTANELCYSNELALHLLELKTNGPVKHFSYLPDIFHQHIHKLNRKLVEHNACLLPTALHPWMDPEEDFKMWPHEYNDIYKTYNAIFNCREHGWCNVQSTHINLPFANDEEFAKLHAAIRLLLPIIPAIAASSPIVELEPSGYMDTRLFYYNQNQKRVPIIAGKVIPEHYTSKARYEKELLENIYHAIAPHDKNKILQYEWLNSRGAIARFDRNTIEIRLMDTQESPLADLTIVSLLVAALQNMVSETWSTCSEQAKFSTQQLREIYLGGVKHGSSYMITDKRYLQAFGCDKEKCAALELWRNVFAKVNNSPFSIEAQFLPTIKTILSSGNLAERILTELNKHFSKKNITETYKKLANCLENNTIFIENSHEQN